MRRSVRIAGFVAAALLLTACGGSSSANDDAGPDAGPDADADSDTDADTDTDADSDGDSDTDADTDADGDVDTSSCPEQDYQVVDIATGRSHTCVVLEGGGVKCWGSNQFGKLGYPLEEYYEGLCSGPTPDTCPLVDVGGPVVQVTAAAYSTCALLESGGVKCWGYDLSAGMGICGGILGYDTVPNSGTIDDPSTMGVCDIGQTVVSISSNAEHTSAITEDEAVVTWGCCCKPPCMPGAESLGVMEFGEPVIQTAAGYIHHCALLENGDVYCWGYNDVGQLGYGHTDFVAAAQVPDQVGPVELGGPAVQVAAGGDHSCAILEGGDVVCWGWGQWGQLGYGDILGGEEYIGDDEVPASLCEVPLM